jgi:low temperature requirement protein LtrA
VIGSQFGELARAPSTVTAFVIAFVGSVVFWWIYFDRSAEDGIEVMATATDPGHLGVTAYTYFHVPMVAGVIAAAGGYELAIAHPGDQVDAATACLILGGSPRSSSSATHCSSGHSGVWYRAPGWPRSRLSSHSFPSQSCPRLWCFSP